MEAVIERLRKSKELEKSLEQTVYMSPGYAWASSSAKFRQLERIADIDVEDFATEFSEDLDNEREAVLSTLAAYIWQSEANDHLTDLAEMITGSKITPTVPQTLGFIEGAQKLWREVEPAI